MSTPQPTILGRKTGPLGYGLMGLTWKAKPQPFQDSIKAMKRALELGADNWNGGEIYGTPDLNSLHLLAAYFTQYPEDAPKVILSIKGGTEKGSITPNSTPENIRRSVDDSLAIIANTSKPKIDIFECARVDPKRGNESAMATLAEYVKSGKIGGIGLSEVSAKTIRRSQSQLINELDLAQGVTSVEVELSLWCPDIFNNGIAATCAELGLPIFAYSPLARGAITDNPIRKTDDLPEGDMRRHLPKFQDDVLAINNQITDAVIEIAREHGSTAAQIAIAWVRGQSGRRKTVTLEDGTKKEVVLGQIIPIPGASSVGRVEENFKDVVLREEELARLDGLVERFPTQGERYHKPGMAAVNG